MQPMSDGQTSSCKWSSRPARARSYWPERNADGLPKQPSSRQDKVRLLLTKGQNCQHWCRQLLKSILQTISGWSSICPNLYRHAYSIKVDNIKVDNMANVRWDSICPNSERKLTEQKFRCPIDRALIATHVRHFKQRENSMRSRFNNIKLNHLIWLTFT